MVYKINENLMNAGRLLSINGVVIHNDAGSMTAEQYVNWLRPRNKNLGIAHYYIDRNCIARVIDTYNIGYHTGDWNSNQRYIGYEVCQSMSANDQDFIANEDMTLMQATEDLIFYGLPINWETVRLHHEFSPTACPHRSLALHGNSTASLKKYFIERMQYFATLGSTVDEMLANYQPNNEGSQENTMYDVLREDAVLENREVPYYKGKIKEDYYVESDADINSDDKELLKKDTEVWVYEKRNGMSRINSHTAEQWIEDSYIYDAYIC